MARSYGLGKLFAAHQIRCQRHHQACLALACMTHPVLVLEHGGDAWLRQLEVGGGAELETRFDREIGQEGRKRRYVTAVTVDDQYLAEAVPGDALQEGKHHGPVG